MKLVEQWRAIQAELPPDWAEAQLELVPELPSERARAAGLLGPAAPIRVGEALRLTAQRGGGATGPEGIRRLLAAVDRARIWSTLRLVDATRAAAAAAAAPEPTLADAWQAAVASLPPDWSDLQCEVRLRSSDYLDRAALLMAPLNPTRAGTNGALRFRAARSFGYGASAEMARRCLERCDAERIRGSVEVLRVLSDTQNVATQGPVWRVAGKSV